MFQTLKSWLSAARPAQPTPAPRRFALHVESLHDRITPSVSLHQDGHLVIGGTSGNDLVTVVNMGTFYRVEERVTNAYYPTSRVTDVPVASVTGHISFYGFDGDDTFANGTALQTFAYGGNGNDVLLGGTARDHLHGQAGDDKLMGYTGSDLLFGGAGNDRLYSTSDRHTDLPETDHNTLDGGDGNDTFHGSDGNDTQIGGNGTDYLYGRGGHDTLLGGAGGDFLRGGDGNDTLDGGVGDGYADNLNGGAGADTFKFDPVKVGGFLFWFDLIDNADAPVDFNPTEDTILRD